MYRRPPGSLAPALVSRVRRSVSTARAGGDHQADLPLLGRLGEPHLDLARIEPEGDVDRVGRERELVLKRDKRDGDSILE
jgi:hypothetical protein